MSEAILDPEYWRKRRDSAPEDAKHHAIFLCPLGRWKAIEAKHREILAKHINFADSILDAGCAWGRLLTLLPSNWGGAYLGVDLSPDFIDEAIASYPDHYWARWDLRQLDSLPKKYLPATKFDWAVMISIRPMILRYAGTDDWERVESQVRKVAKRILYLEYDERDEGKIE